MTEEAILNELSGERARRHVEHITREFPTRMAGTPNGRRMAEYSMAMMTEAGVAAQMHELPGLVSFPRRTTLEVLGSPPVTMAAMTLGHSETTPPEGTIGELIDIGGGGLPDYDGRDVAGKIVVTDTTSGPGRHEKQRLAALHGAIGYLGINWGYVTDTTLPYGSVKPAWGNPTPATFRDEMATLPCVGISRAHGIKLRTMMEKSSVRVRIKAAVANEWRPIQITVGEIKGQTDDFVVVGGHQDSWEGPQATDNATGSACILELARVFYKHRDKLRRGIVFGFWTAHETGTMIGSTWYVDRNWDRLRRHAVAYLQIDQPSCLGATSWGSTANTELRRFQETIDARLTGNRPRSWRRALKIGDTSFLGVGVPMLTSLAAYDQQYLKDTANATLGWWHHTVENTLDKVEWDALPLHMRVYGAYLWELCTAPVLPFDFVAVADEILQRLTTLRDSEDRLNLAPLIDDATAFKDAAGEFDVAAAGPNGAAAADAINTCIKRLSRLLVPVTSTAKGTYGQDSYSLTAQSTVLPSLFELPQLTHPGLDEYRRTMVETQLVRDRNRIADALADARVLIDDCLQRIRQFRNVRARS
jgi:Peptidase family M28